MTGIFFNIIVRNFAKYTYKFLYPKSYKHNRRYWPFYNVIRDEQGQITQVFFRNKLIADHTLNLKIQNKTCLLIGTGPSAKEINEHHFKQGNVDYIGVNGAIALSHIQFKHYIIIDHDFIQNRFDLVQRVLQTACYFFTTARCLDEILKRENFADIKCEFKIIEIFSSMKNEKFMGNTIYQDTSSPHYFFDQDFGFSLNYQDAIFDYYTVAYTALQIIYGLPYQNIYIIGIDFNNLNQPRFYESEQDQQPTLLDQHLSSILKAFNTAATAFQNDNRTIYNLSKNSLLECFPKQEIMLFTSQMENY